MTAPVAAGADARSDLSDEDVVARVRGGDVALYDVLMRRYNQRLHRAVRAILRDESEIEDILQDTYLAAYQSLGAFEGRARFSTWLVRIAVNTALDRRRQCARVVALRDAKEPVMTARASREDPERQSARRQLAHRLEDAIDALPEPFRVVYVLREIEGMNVEETAESLELESNTVKTRLHRARALLRRQLSGDFDAATLQVFPFGGQRCDGVVAAVRARLGATESAAT